MLDTDLRGLRATAADIDAEIAREVADILGHLDLAGAAQRWWQRTRTLTRAPPAPVDVAIDTPDRHPRHLAAFGLGRFEVLVGEPVTRWRSMRGQAVLKVLLVRRGARCTGKS